MANEEKKNVALRISSKNVGVPFKHLWQDKDGNEYESERVSVQVFFDRDAETRRAGEFTVWASQVIDAHKFVDGEKTDEVIDGLKVVYIDPERNYNVKFHEPTGEQIEVEGKGLVNEWADVIEKMSGQDIIEAHKENQKEYKKNLPDPEKEEKSELVKAAERARDASLDR